MKISIKCLKQLSRLKNYKFYTERVLLLFVTISCSGVHYICVINLHEVQKHRPSRQARPSPSAPAKTKRHLRVSFLFCFKAEGLEPRNSKVPALLTVNSPVDCLRIELIIKPLPKKAPNFRCFFPLFTQFYGVFACVSHIDKITALGLFHTPFFHFHTVFCSLCATQFMQFVWYIIKKALIIIQIR